nr:unnamed protein product [Callosobruchus chinensis]
MALRQAVNAPWYISNRQIFEDLRKQPVLMTMKTKAEKFFTRNERHENRLIRKAINYDPRTIERHKGPKTQLLEFLDWISTIVNITIVLLFILT